MKITATKNNEYTLGRSVVRWHLVDTAGTDLYSVERGAKCFEGLGMPEILGLLAEAYADSAKYESDIDTYAIALKIRTDVIAALKGTEDEGDTNAFNAIIEQGIIADLIGLQLEADDSQARIDAIMFSVDLGISGGG